MTPTSPVLRVVVRLVAAVALVPGLALALAAPAGAHAVVVGTVPADTTRIEHLPDRISIYLNAKPATVEGDPVSVYDPGGTRIDDGDVRERKKLGFIPSSTHVPRGMLEFWLDPTSHYYTGKIDPTKRIIVYCAGGQRSALAADVLREMGFPSVAHLAVGFNGWAEAGRKVDREPEGRA